MNARTYKTILAISAVFFFLAILILLISTKETECHIWVPTGNECNQETLKAIPEDCAVSDHEECAYELYNLILDEGSKS